VYSLNSVNFVRIRLLYAIKFSQGQLMLTKLIYWHRELPVCGFPLPVPVWVHVTRLPQPGAFLTRNERGIESYPCVSRGADECSKTFRRSAPSVHWSTPLIPQSTSSGNADFTTNSWRTPRDDEYITVHSSYIVRCHLPFKWRLLGRQ